MRLIASTACCRRSGCRAVGAAVRGEDEFGFGFGGSLRRAWLWPAGRSHCLRAGRHADAALVADREQATQRKWLRGRRYSSAWRCWQPSLQRASRSASSFRWTYYPIALDRKHRQIHVFRLDGTTLSVPWDRVHFTLGRGTGTFGWYNWDVRGLILDADGVTVRETFAFCIATSRIENAHAHWEFCGATWKKDRQPSWTRCTTACRWTASARASRPARSASSPKTRASRVSCGSRCCHQLPAHDHALGGDADQQDSRFPPDRGAPDTGRRSLCPRRFDESTGPALTHQCKGSFSTDGAFAGELKVTVPPNWLMPA